MLPMLCYLATTPTMQTYNKPTTKLPSKQTTKQANYQAAVSRLTRETADGLANSIEPPQLVVSGVCGESRS